MQRQEGRSRSRERGTGRGDEFGRRGNPSRGNDGRGGFNRGPTVSLIASKGSLQLQSNHFKFGLRDASKTVNMYDIDFGQNIGTFQDRRSAIRQLRPDFEKVYDLFVGYGDQIFSQALIHETSYFDFVYKGIPSIVSVSYLKSFSLEEQLPEDKFNNDKILNYILTLCKRALIEEKYNQIGRFPRFFNASDRVKINAHRLEMWPGYSVSVKSLADGIFLNIDTMTKFVNQMTVYDRIRQYQRERYTNQQIKEMLFEDGNLIVITKYNSRQYLINDISFDITPAKHKFDWIYINPENKLKETLNTDMVEYFQIKWNQVIQRNEQNQPCLLVNRGATSIVLPSSLCHESSLPKDFTKDRAKMKSLQPLKINKPQDRYDRIHTVVGKINSNPLLAQWDVKLAPNMAQVKARQLNHAQVYNQYNMISSYDDYEAKLFYHSQPVELTNERWAFVYCGDGEEFEYATKLVQHMQHATRQLGIKLEDPQWIELHDINSPDTYIDAMKSDIDPTYTQFVMVLISSRNLKQPIKKYLDEIGLPSQFVLTATVARCIDGSRISYGPFSMILKQINAKMKKDLYRLVLPNLKRAMVVGIDMVKHGNETILGFSASYNSFLTQYYSDIRVQQLPQSGQFLTNEEREKHITQERTRLILELMSKAMKTFQESNMGMLPEKIVIYRDGIGGPTFMQQSLKHEVGQVVQLIKDISVDYRPTILYSFIDKMSDHRLFMKSNDDVWNPGPGTVIDTALVENQGDQIFDFFMIPHKATVATAMPVQFKIVYNSTDHEKKDIETFTYHLCYGYYNFVGPIKVPAAVMYAKKIATYACDNKIMRPNPSLSMNLHFL